jgi:hypothetical protein
MKTIYRGLLALAASLSVSGCQQAPDVDSADSDSGGLSSFQVPVRYSTLDNGLKVILSQDTTKPVQSGV